MKRNGLFGGISRIGISCGVSGQVKTASRRNRRLLDKSMPAKEVGRRKVVGVVEE